MLTKIWIRSAVSVSGIVYSYRIKKIGQIGFFVCLLRVRHVYGLFDQLTKGTWKTCIVTVF